ncbi:unnamed protein product [Fraxinus pennsylvanica]|uniref:Uncharacterized protein n=1 Tax=Fraxinus pennsylvanica TaxID=56036 RepID=A0AAD1ZKW4_9LAMI|nr:unnamed protein product [Fraxinus pennsylvanica]
MYGAQDWKEQRGQGLLRLGLIRRQSTGLMFSLRGSGRLGAIFWGEDIFWIGTPGYYTDHGVPPILSEVTKFVDDGQYEAATTTAFNLSRDPSNVSCLLTFILGLSVSELQMDVDCFS